MARPKKPPDDRMSDQIRIPLTADQKRLIAEAAGLNALEMTAWARSVLVRAAEMERSSRGRKGATGQEPD
jgi:hypothetical protein